MAKAQGQYVGRWLPTDKEDGIYSRALDALHFLRRFCQACPKQFSKILEKLCYPDAAHLGRRRAGGASNPVCVRGGAAFKQLTGLK